MQFENNRYQVSGKKEKISAMENSQTNATSLLVLDFPITRGETLREKEDDEVHAQGEVIDGLENAKAMDRFREDFFHEDKDL